MMRISSRLRTFLKRDEGTSTVEFVLIFPVIFAIFMSGWESGLLMTRSVLLDRAVDIVVRDLRLGNYSRPGDPPLTHDRLKDEICDRTLMIRDCDDNIRLSLIPVDTAAWVFPAGRQGCYDRAEDIEPVTTVVSGGGDQIMLMQVCVIIESVFPGSAFGAGLRKDSDNGYFMHSRSAFVNEP
jgi:hypothetical protein